jgi:hypothetical protein
LLLTAVSNITASLNGSCTSSEEVSSQAVRQAIYGYCFPLIALSLLFSLDFPPQICVCPWLQAEPMDTTVIPALGGLESRHKAGHTPTHSTSFILLFLLCCFILFIHSPPQPPPPPPTAVIIDSDNFDDTGLQ